MTHLFLSGIALLLTLVGFHRVYCLNGVESAYLGLYKGLLEECVVVADRNGNYYGAPYFFLPKLEDRLEQYYRVNLAPYCREYEFVLRSLDPRAGAEGDDFARAVEIVFYVEIDDIIQKTRKAQFFIERTDNHE